MAIYVVMYSVPEHHIDFMHMHRDTWCDYKSGQSPHFKTPKPSIFAKILGIKEEKAQEPIMVPDGWPTSPPDFLDIGINHRNLGLYEKILYKYPEIDDAARIAKIFLPYITGEDARVPLDSAREAFAYWCRELPGLLLRVRSVTRETVYAVCRDWRVENENGINSEPDMELAEELHQEFVTFADFLKSTIDRKYGLIVDAS